MIGRQLQQYLIVDKAGEGGMGVVWRARDIRLDRDVALKVLPERFADQLGRERFVREAKSASGLNHPNIVTIYEIDSDAGVDFIAMEFIRGVTLFERLNQRALTIAEAIDIATHIADALACAHDAGIVHRDLKPGNIMIAANGTVKVLDFGLAKTGAPQSEPDIAQTPTFAPLTAEGSAVGTPDYMSPEQAVGDPVDKRSDVFSFGVVLYQMLTRTLPFHGSSRSERLRQLHLATPPSIAGLRPEVPPGLIAIVARALEKNPADRYPSMSEVRQALSHVERTAVPAPPRVARFHLARARAIVMAVALATALGGGVWVLSRRAPPPAAAPALAELVPVGSPFDLTQRAVQLLTRHDRVDNVDSAIRLLEQALQQDQNSALAHATIADAYRRKNSLNPDPQWSRLAADSARRALELNPDLAVAQTIHGFVDLDAGRLAEAEAHWKRALDMEPRAAMPHLGLGMAYAVQKRDADAEAALKEAVRLGGTDWRFASELGSFYYRRSRHAEAAAAWETARTHAPDSTIVWRNLGGAYFQLDRYDEAAGAFQRSLEIAPSAAVYTNLGTMRFYQGRYHDAVTAFEKAVELGANRSLYWGNLADGYRWAPGRRGDSIAAYERAIALLRADIAKQPTAIDLRSRLGTYLVKSNQTAAALEAIKDIEREPTLTAQVQMHLTVIHELAGQRDQALQRLAQAVKAGYSVKEIAIEPELTQLRADARYHRLVGALPTR